MKQDKRKIKRWLASVLIIFALLIAYRFTKDKVKEIKETIYTHVAEVAYNGYNDPVLTTWLVESGYCSTDADYQSYTGSWIELVDENGAKVPLERHVLELYAKDTDQGGHFLDMVASVPYDGILTQKWTYIDPKTNLEKYYYVDDLLNYAEIGDGSQSSSVYRQKGGYIEIEERYRRNLPIMITGTRNGIVVTIHELSIDVGQIIADAGGDGSSVEPLRIVFPHKDSEGVEFVYKDPFFQKYDGPYLPLELMGVSGLPHYSLKDVSLFKDGDFVQFGSQEKDNKCGEACSLLQEQPYLKPTEGRLKVENGLFTYAIRCSLSIDSHFNDDKDIDFLGCMLSAVYVSHPLRIAMVKLFWVYLVIAVITIVIFLLYSQVEKRMSDMYERYERSRLAMTRYAAHELKTPLAVARSYAVALAENVEDKEQRDAWAKDMVSQVDSVNVLIEDLLELSRLETNAKQVLPEVIDLTSLTGALLNQIKPLTENLTVTVNAPEGESLVSADLGLMRTVLMNFLSNAARYGESYITVAITKEKNRIRWSVSNDGPAIPESERSRVWDAFFTVDESRSKAKGGTGLGLAITKQILDLHKAKYGCTGDDRETVFFFEMPAAVEEEAAE
ncbi:MAG: HAMP domain-containing histidine kinase [Lachnospiraceae bacterium]|nr:HAMP domain-containing histidine kinase [Lachnospiraceae bacterium]